MEATSISSRTVEVAAAELPGYIARLPRLLTENLTVKVFGTTTDIITFYRFYGSGILVIAAKEGETASIGGVYAEDCCASINLSGLRIQGGQSSFNILLLISGCVAFDMTDCSVIETRSGFNAIKISTSKSFLRKCTFTGVGYVLFPADSSVVTVDDCTGSENIYGVYNGGGAVFLMGSTPELIGGATNIKNGGLIVKRDGTLL